MKLPIPAFCRALLASGLVQARVKNGINAASIFAGGWVMSHLYDWLMAHASFFSAASNMAIAGTVAAGTAGLVLSVGGAIYTTVIDPSNVNAKVLAVGATGDPTVANDSSVVQSVKTAAAVGTPAALSDLLKKLQAGKV